MTLAGVVSTGAPVANAEVTAKCVNASGSVLVTATANANASGHYTMTITAAGLPCLLEANSPDHTIVLHSVAVGANKLLTVDITEVTNLAVADMSGNNDLTAYFANLDQTTLATTFTLAGVAAAQTNVLATLQKASVPTTSITSIFSDDIVTSGSGNTYGAALLALDSLLTSSGTTLAELSATVANSSINPSANPVRSDVASLPADLLLAPAATSCRALRSGIYQFVKFDNLGTGQPDVGQGSINAAGLTTTLPLGANPSGTSTTFTAAPSEPCRFVASDAQSEFVVSRAGVGVMRNFKAGFTLGVFFPRQTHVLSEFVQTANIMGLDFSSGTGGAITDRVAASGGAIDASTVCEPLSTVPSCISGAVSGPISVDAGGGFDVAFSGAPVTRVFLYRAGGGNLLGVNVDNTGSGRGELMALQKALVMPGVNSVTTTWNLYSDEALSAATPIDITTTTVLTTNPTAGTLTRSVTTAGVTFDDALTLNFNTNLPGMAGRPAATVTASNSSTVNIRDTVTLPLAGSGLQISYMAGVTTPVVAPAQLIVSVEQ